MKVLGLTGSIAMGKSTVSSFLRNLRIPVHDSDLTVHHLLSPKGEAFRKVLEAFPDCLCTKRNEIDRSALGRLVFSDSQQLHKLESILHPLVVQSQFKFLKEKRRQKFSKVVLDIPLLYETQAEKRCDFVMVVSAPFFIQKQRVLQRPSMTEEKFQAILLAQLSDQEKRRRADFILSTGQGKARTYRELKEVLQRLY